jgi:hypothetical protein
MLKGDKVDTPIVVSIVFGVAGLIANIVTITIFITRLGGKIDVTNARLENVEKEFFELKNTDRRISVIEERQTNHAKMLATVQTDNLMIRQDLQSLHLGIDRNRAIIDRVNE